MAAPGRLYGAWTALRFLRIFLFYFKTGILNMVALLPTLLKVKMKR